MAFIESPRFPDWIAVWASGGVAFQTSVIRTDGGQEFRNANWTAGLGTWSFQEAYTTVDAASSTLCQKLLRNFFMASMGQFGGFRFKDFLDFKDEGAGVFVMIDSTHFQMYKQYVTGSGTYNHPIVKPVNSTVVVTGGSSPSVDYTTGIVTVSSGTPASWTGEFDRPVRFGDDSTLR